MTPHPHRHRRRDERSLATLAPGYKPPVPPAPPVILLQVVSVIQVGPPNGSIWNFDRDIADPVGLLPGLKINGASPVMVTRLGARNLSIDYPLAVAGGTWSCAAEAAGIESTEGYKLAAGSGTVA